MCRHLESDDITITGNEGGIPALLMAGMAVGRIVAFSAENESISEYLECMELYFAANRVEEERQVPVFLSDRKRHLPIAAEFGVSYQIDREVVVRAYGDPIRSHFEPKKVPASVSTQ